MGTDQPQDWQILIERSRAVLATQARVASSMRDRMVGLLGHHSLATGEGLILTACRSIHTWFMRFAIDTVFVDRQWAVVAVWQALPPWRVTSWVRRAQAVIELPAGTVNKAQLLVGDQLIVLANAAKIA